MYNDDFIKIVVRATGALAYSRRVSRVIINCDHTHINISVHIGSKLEECKVNELDISSADSYDVSIVLLDKFIEYIKKINLI